MFAGWVALGWVSLAQKYNEIGMVPNKWVDTYIHTYRHLYTDAYIDGYIYSLFTYIEDCIPIYYITGDF